MSPPTAVGVDPYRSPRSEPRVLRRPATDTVEHGAWLAFLAWSWTPTLVFWLFVLLQPAPRLPDAWQLVLFFGFVLPVGALWLHALADHERRRARGVALGGAVGFLVTTSGVLLSYGLAA